MTVQSYDHVINKTGSNDTDEVVGSRCTEHPIGRREFLKNVATGGAALLGMPLLTQPVFSRSARTGSAAKPNILIFIVDQMREPEWYPQGRSLSELLPSLSSLKQGAVNFTNAYSAATLCSPARAGLLTGLYTHQNGLLRCVDGDEPPLNTAFETWGGELRKQGYRTNWYGKWHLSNGNSLEDYGFDGGTFPSPNGGPQEGSTVDSHIVDQFLNWFETDSDTGPWATTVSLVNPHDIVYYYKYTEDYFKSNPPFNVVKSLPPNFETVNQLLKKPRLQQAHQIASDKKYGALPYNGNGWQEQWLGFMNAYVAYQQLADRQLGRVLAALDKQPKVRDNTIIVFLSDHGEYGGSHGLRGKGGSAYDEIMHVPLLVKDPTGQWTAQTHRNRDQFVSLVDFYGLLLTLASGDNQWRSKSEYTHLSNRPDIAAMLSNPNAPGRPYVVHTYDEGGEKATLGSDEPIPGHVIGLRSQEAKIVTYNRWRPQTIDLDPDVQEAELYDYSTVGGRLEIDNVSGTATSLFIAYQTQLTADVLPYEIRRPLPSNLEEARQEALSDYYTFLKSNKKKKKLEGDSVVEPLAGEGE